MFNNRLKIYVANRGDSQLVSQYDGASSRFLQANVNSKFADFCSDPDTADIVIVFEHWSFKLQGYSKTLSKDPLLQNYFNKVYVINDDDIVNDPFLPGCYTSLKNQFYEPTLFRPCAYPVTYNEHAINANIDQSSSGYLFSFRGTLATNPIRQVMYDALKNDPEGHVVEYCQDFHSHTEDDKKTYVLSSLQSKFVLCPRGWSPNTYRLYETMSLGRCPVIISDEWVETVGPDWQSCSIRVQEKDIQHIGDILRGKAHLAQELGKNASREWQTHFTDQSKNEYYLQQIIELHKLGDKSPRTLKQFQSRWKSRSFLSSNGWLLTQKIARRLNTLPFKATT